MEECTGSVERNNTSRIACKEKVEARIGAPALSV